VATLKGRLSEGPPADRPPLTSGATAMRGSHHRIHADPHRAHARYPRVRVAAPQDIQRLAETR
jgi:hypothetical protein